MQLILIRHGKAEQSFGKPDIQRDLSIQGKKDIRKKAKRLAEKVQKNGRLYCLSSSANRASQTAKIIIEELTLQRFQLEYREDVGIYRGDFTLLDTTLMDLETKDTLLIVGHQPTLSFWASELSGKSVSFSTGDMAFFDIISGYPLKAKFLWKIE